MAGLVGVGAGGMLRLANTTLLFNQLSSSRSLHTTAVLCQKKAGRHKITRKHNKPLTYEQANPPHYIGVRKAWNSWNTSNFEPGIARGAETAQEDILIRKFITGIWVDLVDSEVVIKRRANQIILSYLIGRRASIDQIVFLIGFTEQILSYLLKCIVKIELQSIESRDMLIYKFI